MNAVSVVSQFVVGEGRSARRMGRFKCSECGDIFAGRMERVKVRTGLCTPCANKHAGQKRSTHGMSNGNSRLHVTWANMKRRCVSPRGKEIDLYRGVTLCDEWMAFEPFMEWSLANGYRDDLTIDRIDPSKGYSPENCRYVDHSVQAANRRLTDKNKSGHAGVSFDRGKWVAKVTWRGQQKHLGRHGTIEEAVAARNLYLDANNLPHLRA